MSLDMDKDLWEQVLMICKKIQQEYYELLPDWNKYQEEDFNLLRQYIGCALGDFNDTNHGREMVSLIYDQIMNYGKESDGSIFCGVIYNIIHEIPKKDETINDRNIMCVPIFKIRNHSKASSYDDSVVTYNIQYIDNNGRLYVDWNDYLMCNKLFECIMVVPKNGYYEADDKFPITEESSEVLVAVHWSPACSKSAEIMNYIDKIFGCLNIGALGISVLSMVIPLGPVVLLAGSAVTIPSGIWMFGRSVQNLIDRTLHGESVSPTNRQALPSWIGVAGTMMGVAMNQGSGVLARAAQAGENVGLATRAAYNTMVVGNVTVNLIGIGFNGYCIAEKYREGRKVEMIDLLSFITHAALFGNTVINMQFAHDIIDSSHGKILQEYEATLRSKRHRKAYNKVKRNAESKAEIVRYVRKVQSRAELLSSNSGSQTSGNNPSGAQLSGTQQKDSQPSGAQSSGTQRNDGQASDSQPSGARSSGTQRNDGQASDSQPSGAQASGDQKSDSLPNGNKQKINKPNSNKSSGSQPSGSQRNGNKPSGARSSGGQPNDSQSNGNKPSDSQASDNQSNGNKPKINEPSSNKLSDSRSNGSKTNDENKSVNKINNKNKSSVKTNDKKLSVCKTNDRKESVDKTNDEIKSGSGINRDIINKITKILFAGGKIYIANSIILDPIEFINNLNEPYGLSEFGHSFSRSINVSVIPLSGRFLKLLADYYGYHPLVSSLKAIPEFHMLLSEMQSIDNAEELLLKVSVLAMRMFSRYLKSCGVSIRNETDLFKIAYILWRYGMAHANGKLQEQDYEEIRSTIISVFDIISDNFETLIPTFLSALNIYWNNFVRSNVLIEN